MASRADMAPIEMSKIRQIASIKKRLCEREGNVSCHLSLALIDSYFWSISKIASSETSFSRKTKREKLKELQELCLRGHEHVQRLQGAVMEIPQLAPAGDESSIRCLSALLDHGNLHVRVNACKSIGLLGGKEAIDVLEGVIRRGDDEMRRIAGESIQYCDMQELAVKAVEKMWSNDEVKAVLTNGVRPYEKFERVIKVVLGIFLAESTLVFLLFLLGRAL